MSLCGDVMLGRGVDQILPHPGDPALRESHVRDARDYVALAERMNGLIPRPVDAAWPWGDALHVLEAAAPDVWVVNLETSITRSDDFAPGKSIHYRMDPANLPSLAAAHPDVCVLANNHVLDFGRRGLDDTLDSLTTAGLPVAGAGKDVVHAGRPAVTPVAGGGRVLVFGLSMESSGVPAGWAATDQRSGVAFVREPSLAAADELIDRVQDHRRPGDRVVASLHWGSNRGYDVPPDHVQFAHRLIDGGVDVVHGHSSHHARPIEVYRDKLVLYGCGDLINDYEGISGYEEYRDDLRPLYLASLEPDTGSLAGLRVLPMQARRLRLMHASTADAAWLRRMINRISGEFGTELRSSPDGALMLSDRRAGAT
jgi:poly-gamma-glutamate synthesis protein (capsule biosynthesis protein)